MWGYGLDWAGPGQGQVADGCECGNETWGSVKCGEFLNQLRIGQLLKPLSPKDLYSGRTALLTSKRCILYIYSTHIGTEYFKHGIYCPFFFLLVKMQFVS